MVNKKTFFIRLIVLIALVALGVLLISDAVTKNSQSDRPMELMDKFEVIQKAAPSVVTIVATDDLSLYEKDNKDFFYDPFFDFPFSAHNYDRDDNSGDTMPVKIGGGSGFIFTENGLILTANHVVSDTGASYTVILSDGREYAGNVFFYDIANDIAILKIVSESGGQFRDLPAAKLGDSSDLEVGQDVIAIGSGNRSSAGKISATGLDIIAGTIKNPISLRNLLRIDAKVTSGYSGGPLINMYGEVIGITVAFAADAKSIGFAIPIDDVKPIIESNTVF